MTYKFSILEKLAYLIVFIAIVMIVYGFFIEAILVCSLSLVLVVVEYYFFIKSLKNER